MLGPKHIEYPKANHRTVVQARDAKLCIMMVRVLPPDKTAVKERQAGRHQHHEAGADKNKSSVADIEWGSKMRHERTLR
jgi:hypothetical protein